MKDRTKECHSPILMQAILSSRKTPNQAVNTKGNTSSIDHLNHLINHLIRHRRNHLNQVRLEDFLQSWQSNTSALFWKHCGKLEADLDSRAEVSQSSSVLFTSIQVKVVSILVDDVIDINCAVFNVKCPFNQNPVPPVPGSRFPESRSCLILLPNHWKELHSV